MNNKKDKPKQNKCCGDIKGRLKKDKRQKTDCKKRKPAISKKGTKTNAIAKRNKRLEEKRVLIRLGNGNGNR